MKKIALVIMLALLAGCETRIVCKGKLVSVEGVGGGFANPSKSIVTTTTGFYTVLGSYSGEVGEDACFDVRDLLGYGGR